MAPKEWFEIEYLKNKEYALHSSRKVTGSTLELSVDGRQVEQVCSFKFLGVTINDILTWSDHINTVCAKVSDNLNLLHRLTWFLPQPLLFLFLTSYILPLFDYCDVVWSGCTKSEASRLETLLNYACHTVLHKQRGSSALAARRELGLSTLASRRKSHLALTMFNCTSSKSPLYLSQSFSFAFIPLQHLLCFVFPAQPSTQLIFLWPKVIQFHGHSTVAIPATEHPGHQRIQQLLLTLLATFY